jgi:putative ABC transport system permease protein
MFSTRWHKALRDLWVNKARTILVVLAIAIGVFGVGTILTAYSILTREMDRNYMDTNPASAILSVEGIDDDLVQTIQDRPEIADAEARRKVLARYQMGPNEWISIYLFVVDDFDDLRVNIFYPERGGWNPGTDEILMERSGLPLIEQDVGDEIVIKTAAGTAQTLTITGIVHDPGRAPAWMEGFVYGYISSDGLARLGEEADLNQLRVVVAENASDQAAVRRTAESLRDWLTSNGFSVQRVEVPAPGEHPHNDQMMTLLFLLETFGILALALSGILVATMISALMGQQLRQIGVMKTVGARRRQIAGIYLATVMFLGVMALIIGIPAGVWAGRAYADYAAATLNFEIASYGVGSWVYLVQIVAAVLIPVIGAAFPISKGSRITVREAIRDAGVSQTTIGTRRIDALLGRVQGLGRTLLLALRNTFRRQGRLVLTLLVLAAGGAVFMVALNVGASWNKTIDAQFAARRYDLEIRLKQFYAVEQLETVLSDVPGVVKVETWAESSVSILSADSAGDPFRMLALPPDTSMVAFPLVEGRWLRPDERNAVVVNHMLVDHEPSLKVGNDVLIELNGQDTTWRVVGVVRQAGPKFAYVNQDGFVALTGLEGRTNHVRVVTDDHDPAGQAVVLQSIEARLANAGVVVVAANTTESGRQVFVDHLFIIVTFLMLMAALVAAVGGLGLMSTMSLNILERRRELGVMRAVGATSMKVLQVVLGEGMFIGLLSWALAIILSLPLTALVANVSGQIFIEAPLELAYSPSGVGLWLGLVVVLAAIASSLPALKAAEMPVHEVLASEQSGG